MEPLPRAFPIWRTLAGVLLVGVMVGVLLSLWPRREAAPEPAPQQPKAQPAPPPGPLQSPAPASKAKGPEPAAKMMRYPDGSAHPSLNGVKDPPFMNWPAEIPFSPVVGQFKDEQGLEWYRHADGSRSTVQMIWRKDIGRMEAVARVDTPTSAAKVDPGEAPAGKKD